MLLWLFLWGPGDKGLSVPWQLGPLERKERTTPLIANQLACVILYGSYWQLEHFIPYPFFLPLNLLLFYLISWVWSIVSRQNVSRSFKSLMISGNFSYLSSVFGSQKIVLTD